MEHHPGALLVMIPFTYLGISSVAREYRKLGPVPVDPVRERERDEVITLIRSKRIAVAVAISSPKLS